MAGRKVSKKVSTINRRTTRLLYLYGVKLLQKSEMRKDIVIELSYKGFS